MPRFAAHLPTHSSDLFTYSKGKFIAEISDLPRPVMASIYDDAIDLGINIKSGITGEVRSFRIKDEKRDAEGDLEVIVMEPLDLNLRRRGVEVHLLND